MIKVIHSDHQLVDSSLVTRSVQRGHTMPVLSITVMPAEFQNVTHKMTERGRTLVYRRVVAEGKPNYQGSGRKIEEITMQADGTVYSKTAQGYVRQHASLDEAAASLEWVRE